MSEDKQPRLNEKEREYLATYLEHGGKVDVFPRIESDRVMAQKLEEFINWAVRKAIKEAD